MEICKLSEENKIAGSDGYKICPILLLGTEGRV